MFILFFNIFLYNILIKNIDIPIELSVLLSFNPLDICQQRCHIQQLVQASLLGAETG